MAGVAAYPGSFLFQKSPLFPFILEGVLISLALAVFLIFAGHFKGALYPGISSINSSRDHF